MFGMLKRVMDLNLALSGKLRALRAYEEGRSLLASKRYKEAFPLLKESAELGHAPAAGSLGCMYFFGQGVPKSGVEAVQWLEIAVAENVKESRGLLGMILVTGQCNANRDIERGRVLLEQAVAEEGDKLAAQMLEQMAKGIGVFRK